MDGTHPRVDGWGAGWGVPEFGGWLAPAFVYATCMKTTSEEARTPEPLILAFSRVACLAAILVWLQRAWFGCYKLTLRPAQVRPPACRSSRTWHQTAPCSGSRSSWTTRAVASNCQSPTRTLTRGCAWMLR